MFYEIVRWMARVFKEKYKYPRLQKEWPQNEAYTTHFNSVKTDHRTGDGAVVAIAVTRASRNSEIGRSCG